MSENNKISNSVISRLPKYYRCLLYLKEEGVIKLSSIDLSYEMGLTPSQIRQDLNCFGGFGLQGYGYNVEDLINQIGAILGLKNKKDCILIGVGNLGKAILKNIEFDYFGFNIVSIYDKNPNLIGSIVNGLKVKDLENLNNENKVDAAILCIQNKGVKKVARFLIKNNIKTFLNFSNVELSIEFPEAIVENISFEESMMRISFKLKQKTIND